MHIYSAYKILNKEKESIQRSPQKASSSSVSLVQFRLVLLEMRMKKFLSCQPVLFTEFVSTLLKKEASY